MVPDSRDMVCASYFRKTASQIFRAEMRTALAPDTWLASCCPLQEGEEEEEFITINGRVKKNSRSA